MLLEQTLRRTAKLWPDRIAARESKRTLTYSELDERVNRLANALVVNGIRPGDRVGVLMLNSISYLELYYAINIAGGIIVPLNYRLSVPELVFMLNDCGARILVSGQEYVEVARRIGEGCPAIAHLILVSDRDTPDDFISYEEFTASGATDRPDVSVSETDPAAIFYTGGTTGLPKGVMLSHRNLIDNLYRIFIYADITGHSTYLHSAPMFHVADGAAVWPVTAMGGTHSILAAFDPLSVFQTIEHHRVTHAVFVPTMINALINHPDLPNHDLSSLKRISYGASAIAESTLDRAMELLGCDFLQVFGMTETSPMITALTAEDHHLDGSEISRRRLRSVGLPAVGIDLRIVDENDREVPPETVGEIVLRGDNVMLGYWKRPEETAQALRGGWLHTGDLGMTDDGGYVYIVDRRKDMIISGGENVYSIEVENAIASHPSVLEAAVIGVPDDYWGETVTAVIVVKPDHELTADELVDHCRQLIARYKVPKKVVFSDALPKSGAGKILKREIRKEFGRKEEPLIT